MKERIKNWFNRPAQRWEYIVIFIVVIVGSQALSIFLLRH